MPRFLGQHFLKNESVIREIVRALDVQKGDTIIEIGPGHGELTIPLATMAEKVGARIIAVERDEQLAAGLRTRTGTAGTKTVEIVNDDILQFLKSDHLTQYAHSSFKLAGNIPYYLTGHLLRIVSEVATDGGEHPKLERAIFMTQKEVAQRICAAPPRMNRLAASVQFWAEPKIIANVPRTDFSPPPEVDSAVIKLEAKWPGSESGGAARSTSAEHYYAAVRALFAQPRKTIFNNLRAKVTDENMAEILQSVKIDPKSRPQDLTIENITQIAKLLFTSSSVHK